MKLTKKQLKKIIGEEIQNIIPKKDWTQDIRQAGNFFYIPSYGRDFVYKGRGPAGEYIFYDEDRTIHLRNIVNVDKHAEFGPIIYWGEEK
jgi:hypothetical protein